ncbi:DUF7017 domain-containing protein [Rhizobium ruizarguesonis]|uniref:DUF7017 domain-containing protein n=1 Tax=Rhizobium TaxID=379 RepID=UPI0010310B84|nr:hypothetical protein [Rhizobium ruizarguesonis]TBC80957.1 hypothetical protein ELH30_24625 [Rhizobium ruizarguesonis]
MKPSQQVTALRKAGQLDEAFKLAAELVAVPGANEWELGAYGWCLIDLVRRHAVDQDQASLRDYLGLLTRFEVPGGNDLLAEHRERALSLGDADRRAVLAARKLGKDGQHDAAVKAFSAVMANGSLTKVDQVAFGWELYRVVQDTFRSAGSGDLPTSAIDAIKRNLNTYLKLGISEPGLLHSLMMQQAIRLSHGDHLRLVAFARLWGLDLFQSDDFRETRLEDGKTFPPLAEAVLQRASKEAAKGGSQAEMHYILPHLERGLSHFPENAWLKLNMVKVLRGLERVDDARRLATDFARSKAGDYWTWELIGDLEVEPEMQLSCYAKALSCSEDDTFVSKLRLKFASLIRTDHPGEARAEVERVIEHRRREGTRVPAEAQKMAESAWFQSAITAATGRQFYERFKHRAEELLFAHIPWTDASIGDEFVIEGKDGQKDRVRRRLLVKSSPLPLEVSVPAGHPDVRRCLPGAPIKVQMEVSSAEPWKATVHRIHQRDGTSNDVVPELCGVVDHINHGKHLLHFVVAKDIEGTISLNDFSGPAEIGQAVAVRMTSYRNRQGVRTRVLSASSTTLSPGPDVMKRFDDDLEIRNGLGFTSTGIFIPADIIAISGLADGDRAEGLAIINFDKKRNKWGWKAISAK